MNSFVKVYNTRYGRKIINKTQIVQVTPLYMGEDMKVNKVSLKMSNNDVNFSLIYDEEMDTRPGTVVSRMIEDVKLLTGIELSELELTDQEGYLAQLG